MLGRLVVVRDVDLQAAQRVVPAEAIEFDLGVSFRRASGDGRVPQLVQILARCVPLPERVGLAIGEAGIALRCQVGVARIARLPRHDEEGAVRRLASFRQVGVEVDGDAVGEEHLARPVALALDADASLRPVDVLDVDRQGLVAA